MPPARNLCYTYSIQMLAEVGNMKSIKWKILRRIGAFVLAAALVAGGQPFCSCADEAAAEEEIGPGIIPKV